MDNKPNNSTENLIVEAYGVVNAFLLGNRNFTRGDILPQLNLVLADLDTNPEMLESSLVTGTTMKMLEETHQMLSTQLNEQ